MTAEEKINKLHASQIKAKNLIDKLEPSELHSIFYLASKEILRGALREGTKFEEKFWEILNAYREGQN